jgi:hypothetical protein
MISPATDMSEITLTAAEHKRLMELPCPAGRHSLTLREAAYVLQISSDTIGAHWPVQTTPPGTPFDFIVSLRTVGEISEYLRERRARNRKTNRKPQPRRK